MQNKVVSTGTVWVYFASSIDGFYLPNGGTWCYHYVNNAGNHWEHTNHGAGSAAGGSWISNANGNYSVIAIKVA